MFMPLACLYVSMFMPLACLGSKDGDAAGSNGKGGGGNKLGLLKPTKIQFGDAPVETSGLVGNQETPSY